MDPMIFATLGSNNRAINPSSVEREIAAALENEGRTAKARAPRRGFLKSFGF